MDRKKPDFSKYDGVIPKADDFLTMMTYMENLIQATTNMLSPGVIRGLVLTAASSTTWSLTSGSGLSNDRKLLTVDTLSPVLDAMTISTTAIKAAAGGTVWLVCGTPTVVESRENIVRVPKPVIIRDSYTLVASVAVPAYTTVMPVASIASGVNATGYNLTTADLTPIYATNVFTHTGAVGVDGTYTGPKINGTSGIQPLSITEDSLAGGITAYSKLKYYTVNSLLLRDKEINNQKMQYYNSLVPVGSILPYAGPVPNQDPNVTYSTTDGVLKLGGDYTWLFCDGRVYSISTYPKLYDVIKDTWNGSNNTAVPSGSFKVPDLRGQFLRGYDATRTIDTDVRALGSYQADSVGPHGHEIYRNDNRGDSKNSALDAQHPSDYEDKYRISTIAGVNVGAETRPKNMCVNYIICTGHRA